MPRLEIVFLILSLCSLIYFEIDFFSYIQDDTFITFRYIENFLAGKGLLFNEREPPVEGFSNFLWLALILVLRFFFSDTVIIGKILGAIFGIGILILLFIFHVSNRCKWNGREFPFYAGFALTFLLCINPCFVAWSVSGMEIPFYTFSLLLTLFIYLKGIDNKYFKYVPYLLAAISLTRPEGIMFFVVFTLDLIFEKFDQRWNFELQQIFFWFARFLIIISSFLIFRWLYYGDIFPNTFYAKAGFAPVEFFTQDKPISLFQVKLQNAIRYYRDFLNYGEIWLIFLLILPLVFQAYKHPSRIYLLIILAQFLFILWAGGDYLYEYRFFMILLPFLILCSIEGLYILEQALTEKKIEYPGNDKKWQKFWNYGWMKRFIFFIFTFLIFLLFVSHLKEFKPCAGRIKRTYAIHKPRMELAMKIKDALGERATVAYGDSGVFFYYGNMRCLDILGLNDRFIAKTMYSWRKNPEMGLKIITDYVINRSPEVIILTVYELKNNRMVFDSMAYLSIYNSPSFKQRYKFLGFVESGPLLAVFCRNDINLDQRIILSN